MRPSHFSVWGAWRAVGGRCGPPTPRARGLVKPRACWRPLPRSQAPIRGGGSVLPTPAAAPATAPFPWGGLVRAGNERTRRNLAGLLARQSHQGRLLTRSRHPPPLGWRGAAQWLLPCGVAGCPPRGGASGRWHTAAGLSEILTRFPFNSAADALSRVPCGRKPKRAKLRIRCGFLFDINIYLHTFTNKEPRRALPSRQETSLCKN